MHDSAPAMTSVRICRAWARCMPLPFKASDQHGHGVFDIGLEGGKKLGAKCTVDNAVVDRERDGHHRGDFERVVFHDRALLAPPDGQD